jgi:predicted heme/steroid binding protein
MGRNKVLEPQAIDGMIAEGHIIVIYEDMVLRLDTWLHKHPGGRLAILHMVGRDATDEMKAYVKYMLGLDRSLPRSSTLTQQQASLSQRDPFRQL